MPSDADRRLLFLQNALATGAGLLFQAGETLGEVEHLERQCILKIEIAAWFLETRESLSAVLSEPPEKRESSQSARPAETPGLGSNWVAPTLGGNTSSPDGSVRNMEPTCKQGGPFGNSSSGGTGDSPQPSARARESSPPNSSKGKSSVKLPSFWA